jgi:cell division protein FtsQ
MKKLKWNNIRLLLMLLAIVFLYAFSLDKNNKREVSQPEVEFLGESKPFITQENVNNLLIEKLGKGKTILKDELVLNALESVLTDNGAIENAEVFVTTAGKLKVLVKQKTPIARVFEQNRSFYIDYQGTEMPLSTNFSARVPLVTARITPENKPKLVRLLKYIYQDDFLAKNIISMEVKDDNSLVMKNRNYDFNINFGKITNIERKFNNYKAFYQKAVQDSWIEQYSEINLIFTRQVVCTKK